jgi:endonuclease YncB( thermonuclease family)
VPAPGKGQRRTRKTAPLLLLAALLALPLCASALEGQVIHIADGDTLTVLDDQHRSHKIRLAGIDAPERGQPFGRRATEALAALAKNRHVVVSGGKTDRYQRRIGIVRVAPAECASCKPSVDVGLSLINAGLAWHYRAYEREQSRSDREQYRLAEDGARTRGDGLWTDATPMPPWDWRRARRDGNVPRQ